MEIRNILGLESNKDNPDAIAALYNYLSLLFAGAKDIDYSKLKLYKLKVDYEPNGEATGMGKSYKDNFDSIVRKCQEFYLNIKDNIPLYENNPKYRYHLMKQFNRFYSDIMESLTSLNRYTITGIRNAIEHANFDYQNGEIVMIDQDDHSNSNNAVFKVTADPKDLFTIAKEIELDDEEFTINDFLLQLKPIIGDELYTNIADTMNKLSIIGFGKDIKREYTMKKINIEGLTNVLKRISEKKLQ